jgi:polyisoprenoid-binding protein YceI
MKTKIKVVLLVLSYFFIMAFNINAKEWTLDKAHSIITFDVAHIYSATKGHFSDYKADIVFDKNDLKNSKFNFIVKTDSINTYITKRDNHLRSGDFFDAKKFPEMKFTSTEIKHLNGSKYLLKGKMTIKDVTKNIEIKGDFLGQKNHPLKKGTMVAGFETKFTINRLDYNVGNGKFYKMGVVGKDVEVFISIEVTGK